MPESELVRVTAAKAAEVCEGRTLSDEARALLTDGLTPHAYLEALVKAGHYTDAEMVLAHALPKREAVWWACRCVRSAIKPDDAKATAALNAAEAWIVSPGDVNRRKAYDPAEAVGFDHPAGCAALAAYFSGGSLAPPQYTAVPPANHLTGDCAAIAIKLAALAGGPLDAPEKHKAFFAIGLEVARGKDRWKDNL